MKESLGARVGACVLEPALAAPAKALPMEHKLGACEVQALGACDGIRVGLG